MFTARACMSAVENCDEIEARSYDGPIVDGWSARQFARQNGGDVTLWDSHLSLAFILEDQITRAHTDCVPSLNKATEKAPESAS
eukprot:743286-Pleurochrysis_carterae.AAC.2